MQDSAQRSQVLKNIGLAIEKNLNQLLESKVELSRLEVPEVYQEIFKFQVLTLDYGIMSTQAAKEWFENLSASLKE